MCVYTIIIFEYISKCSYSITTLLNYNINILSIWKFYNISAIAINLS